MVGGIIISVSLFAAIFGILYVWLVTRHKERLALIEKNMDAGIFKHGKGNHWSKASLGTGMFLAGIAVGILVGALLANLTTLSDGVSYSSMIILFAGLSLIIYYLTGSKSAKKEQED